MKKTTVSRCYELYEAALEIAKKKGVKESNVDCTDVLYLLLTYEELIDPKEQEEES